MTKSKTPNNLFVFLVRAAKPKVWGHCKCLVATFTSRKQLQNSETSGEKSAFKQR